MTLMGCENAVRMWSLRKEEDSCTICLNNFNFDGDSAYSRHFNDYHGDSKKAGLKKAFENLSTFATKELKEGSSAVYFCTVCAKIYSTVDSYKRHGCYGLAYNYACKHCGLRFFYVCVRNQHENRACPKNPSKKTRD